MNLQKFDFHPSHIPPPQSILSKFTKKHILVTKLSHYIYDCIFFFLVQEQIWAQIEYQYFSNNRKKI